MFELSLGVEKLPIVAFAFQMVQYFIQQQKFKKYDTNT